MTEPRKKTISVDELLRKRFNTLPFEGAWADAYGTPEAAGTWIFWGNSGNGKTRHALQLAKYLTRWERVLYNTLEEGAKLSFQMAIKESRMGSLSGKFQMLDMEPMTDLMDRLTRKRSANVVIIDSLQYSGLNKATYRELKESFRKKLFIFISHAQGRAPKGQLADDIRYDADVKTRIEGYRAYPMSRYGGGQPFTIWHQGAEEYEAI